MAGMRVSVVACDSGGNIDLADLRAKIDAAGDRLAALVAHLISADALILLSDVDALYDSDPRRGDATAVSMVGGSPGRITR